MSSTPIQVTTSTLRTKRDDLSTLKDQFNNQLSKMDSCERELLSMWEGEAAKEFHKTYTTDQAKMEDLYKAVAQYCEALGTIITKYETAERKNVEIARTRR